MKKLISLLLVLLLCVSFVACGADDDDRTSRKDKEETSERENDRQDDELEEPEQTEATADTEQTQPPTEITEPECWTVDVTSAGEVLFMGLFTGHFSNSATVDADLTGCVYMMADPTGDHFSVSFRLLEYGEDRVTYDDSDVQNMTLQTKILSDKAEFSLYGVAPDGDLYLGLDDGSEADYFLENLYLGYDIRCTITVGDSHYQFTVESDGFADAFRNAYGIHSPQDALYVYRTTSHGIAGAVYLNYHWNETEAVTGDQLAQLLPGYWYSKNMRTNAYGSIWLYDESTAVLVAEVVVDTLHPKESEPRSYVIEGDILRNSYDYMYMFMRIQEGYYLVFMMDPWGVESMYLYVQCDENGVPLYPL